MKTIEAEYIGNRDDFTEDYPVSEYTKKSGVKVKAHNRGEGYLERYEREHKEEILKKKFEKHNIKNEKLLENYDDYLQSILDLLQHEKATPKEIAEVLDDLNIREIHIILKVYFGMPYNEHVKRMRFGYKHGFTPSKKRWLEGHRTEDYTEDYPVEGYTKESGIKVKAHTRGESERYLGNYAKSKKYPGKYIRIIKGKVFIEYRSVQVQSGRGTEKAINVGGVWIPRSQVWYDSPHATHANIYVSEWFYPKLERKETEHEIESLERQIQSTEENIKKYKKKIEIPERFSDEDPEKRLIKLKKYIKEDEELLKSIKKQKEERIKWLKENSVDDFDEDFTTKRSVGKYIGTLVNDSGYDEWKAGKKGKWITVKGTHLFIMEGEKKQSVLDKIKTLKKTPILKKEVKKEPEEKQRKELEVRTKKYKRPTDLSEREKAIQKLIEETGYKRIKAENIIEKKMGKEEPKKIPKKPDKKPDVKTGREIERQKKQIDHRIKKLQKLNDKKYKFSVLTSLINLITSYLITGKGNTAQFITLFLQMQMSRKIDAKQKESLSREIQELRSEIRTLYEKKDFTIDYLDYTDWACREYMIYLREEKLLNDAKAMNKYIENETNVKIVDYLRDKKNKDRIIKIVGNITNNDLREDNLTHDFVGEMNDITLDFYEQKEDFTILHGPITRAGAFEYEKNGRSIIYYKDWENIKEVVKKIDYIPLKASVGKGAHHAKILGYATNFKPNDKTEQMFADIVLFNNINEVTNLLNPENGYAVSIGFKDRIENGIQWIEYVDHLAMSLLNADQDRCSTVGGKPCYAKQKEMDDLVL